MNKIYYTIYSRKTSSYEKFRELKLKGFDWKMCCIIESSRCGKINPLGPARNVMEKTNGNIMALFLSIRKNTFVMELLVRYHMALRGVTVCTFHPPKEHTPP